MKKETFYCLVLSESQARFLATSKYGIDRMKALMSLVELASTENRTYEKKGFSANLNVGQLVMSEIELSRLWKCDRKTVSRVLDTMNELGIVSTTQNNRTSIHTLLCISAWYVNGQRVINPYYVPMKDRVPEGNSTPVNIPAYANDNADDSTKEPTPSGQLHTDVQDGNIPNQQQPVTPHSVSQQPSHQGQTSMKAQEPTSNGTDQSDDQQPPAPQYHSIREKVMDELNEMPK
ncbi:MAG: hypothetical protein J6Q22_12725 [Prevotella sp.]|nr:hypothetical protein [Prevotella sp.]